MTNWTVSFGDGIPVPTQGRLSRGRDGHEGRLGKDVGEIVTLALIFGVQKTVGL